MFLMSLANSVKIDVGAAVFTKMEAVKLKYPPEKFRGRYERPLNNTNT